MTDDLGSGSHRTGGEPNKIREIHHFTGAQACHYGCGEPAEFVVSGTTGDREVTFAGCLVCLNRAAIYPIENRWVDERTDQVENA